MPPYIAPEVEVALINAASSLTAEFLRNGCEELDEKKGNIPSYFDENFVAYYFRNILLSLKRSYLEVLRTL
ncbi:hypothetical protein K6W36_09030 [Acetobacter senegalensis]|uniref:hypothetical protein n=1 Tax=Acetobacter senegalensis TaxID=446692 RepID=UPI001ED9E317|nr:hypothetical protein [Acetobacter senegalensis]MCG4260728.1 hypothetical protein [Acetobacter senegalensis]